ncbi:30S ribosomal protein S1 [Polystyrenella longa]|uniref:30S ribosomal protein S1 n=1 Tax=Polystyrenella longa TaxID=2528007 RepID=A0A518CK23_9PLAN|nr:Tex family protein [Polystyrenella longa]QDU79573.1 30S ribosomal protein S1 [Polystyrenella longa]
MVDSATPDFTRIAQTLDLKVEQVTRVTELLDEGNTVPFITRYRKEQTGNLDEQQIRAVAQAVNSARQLLERAETIVRLIDSQGKLTDELKKSIQQADSLKRLEDLYLPYRPKRRSRAAQARERGLEPLAELVRKQSEELTDLNAAAQAYVDPAQELPDLETVLQGVSDLLAEGISEQPDLRHSCRRIAWKTGEMVVTVIGEPSEKAQAFRDYFDYKELVSKIPAHRILAINRGEKSNFLRVKFNWDGESVLRQAREHLALDQHRFKEFMEGCLVDCITRLIHPSLEREVRRELTEKAEDHAVDVFAQNLRNLLLQPPVRGEKVLAVDPGFRTGCKLAVLDEHGNCLRHDVMYVTGSEEKRAANRDKLVEILNEHDVKLIAVGNGTACRETEELISEMISEKTPDVRYVIVNEAGASIYSTSNVAREEFPKEDATVRGTISIGRRLLDPLSELVKIDPQHIGVGMYQHDLSVRSLRDSLDEVVESCVNYVGVDLNTASFSLLRHVSGLNQLIARRMIEWREKNGPFNNRAQLREIAGLGEATFTQAAGFLKIPNGPEPLDQTWIHPESYGSASKVLAKVELDASSLSTTAEAVKERQEKLSQLSLDDLAGELATGLPTLKDIIENLCRPGRDPRQNMAGPIFKSGILNLSDLQEGMELRGTVLNVVDFGVFVDIGLKDSGLIHISQLGQQYIKSPHDVVAVGDVVRCWVMGIDQERRRVSLTLIDPAAPVAEPATKPKPRRRKKRPSKPKEGTPAPSTNSTAQKPTDKPKAAKSRAQRNTHKPKKPLPKLTEEVKSGQTPMRGFDELKSFWKDK